MAKPNILFILTDQQRWDAMGCSGDWVNTPHLDRMAATGVRFSNCVTNSPTCIPARVSLATGRYPHNTGIWSNLAYDLPVETPTWMQAIREAGYRTSLFGKTHLHQQNGDLREREHLVQAYGLDDVDEIGGPWASARVLSHMTAGWKRAGLWEAYREDFKERFHTKRHMARPSPLPFEQYPDVYVGQKAKAYLDTYSRSEPWFCWVGFGGPHEPWDAPEPYASMYPPSRMPKAAPAKHGLQCYPKAIRKSKKADLKLTTEDVAAMRANYAGNVSLIDDQIGEILQVVEARGELENTVIVFTSDHGEMNGDHGLIYKSNFLNGSVRVPLIIRTPDVLGSSAAGTVADSPVELFDIGPTMVALAGGELHHQQYAKSLCPSLADPGVGPRGYAISEIHGDTMYLDRRWKLALSAKGKPYLLFDREADPLEQDNLVAEASATKTISEIRIRIKEHLIATRT